ncbi:hypothetical protein Tco_1577260 [Tanacetum coccineum]
MFVATITTYVPRKVVDRNGVAQLISKVCSNAHLKDVHCVVTLVRCPKSWICYVHFYVSIRICWSIASQAVFVVQPTENKMAPKGTSEPHIGCSDGVVPPDTEEGTGIKSAEMKNVISEATHVVKKPGTTLPKTIIDFAVQCHTCRKWRKLETEEHF